MIQDSVFQPRITGKVMVARETATPQTTLSRLPKFPLKTPSNVTTQPYTRTFAVLTALCDQANTDTQKLAHALRSQRLMSCIPKDAYHNVRRIVEH